MFFKAKAAVYVAVGVIVALTVIVFFIFGVFTLTQKGAQGTDTTSPTPKDLSPEEKQAILAQLESASSVSVPEKQEILKKINPSGDSTLTAEEKAAILQSLEAH
ncbi:MAG: hypothetical protein G01um101456_686 [Parcubacteria group bacterium Gr01-1014_56]|nr:MAG: hypothetical protein G01um101456_686 [Parcubacteria group bacterium Gr01-1014_56]